MTALPRELLNAVLDAPDDTEPRLVAADWFLERGDPRGEFILAQCALLGRLSRSPRKELSLRMAEFLAENEEQWTGPAQPLRAKSLEDSDDRPWRFRAGFIDYLVADANALVAGGEALWSAEPVRRLKIMKATTRAVVALAEQAFMARIRHLAIRGRVGDRGVAALAQSPHLAKLQRLNLRGTKIGDRGARKLAESEVLSCAMIALTDNEIGDEGASALAGSPVLAAVERLYLSRNDIGDEGVIALAESPHVGGLREFGLGGNDLSDSGAKALCDSTSLPATCRLEVDMCHELGFSMIEKLRQRFARVRA